ncbi:hypothetical protein AVEN_166094-1 [Araneus ventricosus]|uniref:DUF4817 domain-containing protein n=1 Tax=Araneus ventricosus TaxID=182803 RepID=A0A4Y2FSK6_ARAVE|nr:hypothetical protein AVEN_166094-1 [Araneus ventricosus]
MMLTLQEKALLVKLLYLNQQNSVAAVKEFRRMQQIRRGPMSPCALLKKVQEFETTGQLGILPGRGRKQIPSSSVEDVGTAVVEASNQSPHGSDVAPPDIDRHIKKLLRQHFTDAREISRHFPTAWPPRSPDITPCDFWLWSFLKDNIYRKRPATLPDLKDSIRRHVLDIPAESLRLAVVNMVLRLEHIVEHEGGHIEQF